MILNRHRPFTNAQSALRRGVAGTNARSYRLVILAGAAVAVGAVRFWLNGSGTYRNPDRIVHLYDYLLAGARQARESTVAAEILFDDATVVDGLAGPFRAFRQPTALR